MALPRTPRLKWIEEGLRVLGEAGADAVRVEVLAKRLGVTKGGFYGYFVDRDALLAEMLDAWEYEVTERIVELVEADGGDAREKLSRIGELVSRATTRSPPVSQSTLPCVIGPAATVR